MRILGIDYGDARTGLSISDPSGFLAGSPSVIHEWNYAKLVDKLVAFIQENKIEEIVLGHPKNMDGTVGPRAEKCETLAKELEELHRTARCAVGRAPHDGRRTRNPAPQRQKREKAPPERRCSRGNAYPAGLSGF